jgi:asparagine synthase (glutamine-hydrolysing)
MCGIAGIISLNGEVIPNLSRRLAVMNGLQAHRGPDGEGIWVRPDHRAGFAHRRLAIIDLTTGDQPMRGADGSVVSFNGEIYNYLELREELGPENFSTTSDTEVILEAHRRWGSEAVSRLRGMFAYALWDESRDELFIARDRFGIKPFYYAVVGGTLHFASEAKALLPFLDQVETDLEGLKDYLAFQFCMDGKTLFKGIRELPPGHTLRVRRGSVEVSRYWEVWFRPDFDHTAGYFEERVRHLIGESVRLHLRSDVPVGAYVSGGVDSGIMASMAAVEYPGRMVGFNGRFAGPDYDESRYARDLAAWRGFPLEEVEITAADFVATIGDVIRALDQPVAGPGSFPQYHVSKLAARSRKVVLGGQGGDEIFGGYARYLLAYFEQCIKAAIDGTMSSGRFVVTYESIIPNLTTLRQYKPLIREFWREGLFEDMDRRYFRLINRTSNLADEIRLDILGDYSPFDTFRQVFHGDNVGKQSYFDSMTHFDFKTLLPALLQVEDRMSMAHGLESRVPFLDHPLVELAATIPSDIKFKDGKLKKVLLDAMRSYLPASIAGRTDKMGFPVPLNEWIKGDLGGFVRDLFSTRAARERPYFNTPAILAGLDTESKFGRKVWGLLSLELWHRAFHDRAHEFRKLLTED